MEDSLGKLGRLIPTIALGSEVCSVHWISSHPFLYLYLYLLLAVLLIKTPAWFLSKLHRNRNISLTQHQLIGSWCYRTSSSLEQALSHEGHKSWNFGQQQPWDCGVSSQHQLGKQGKSSAPWPGNCCVFLRLMRGELSTFTCGISELFL